MRKAGRGRAGEGRGRAYHVIQKTATQPVSVAKRGLTHKFSTTETVPLHLAISYHELYPRCPHWDAFYVRERSEGRPRKADERSEERPGRLSDSPLLDILWAHERSEEKLGKELWDRGEKCHHHERPEDDPLYMYGQSTIDQMVRGHAH